MIKLTDLLKELDIRKGQLRGVINDDIMYNYFAVDFGIAEEDLDDAVNESLIKGKYDELIEVEGYRLIEATQTTERTKWLVKPDAPTWRQYIVGSVEMDLIDTYDRSASKAYKISGAQVVLSYVSKQYRGKGIGSLMYYMIFVHYGNLFSDKILYEGSYNLWLSKIYPIADFFGIEVWGSFYAPVTLEDASNVKLMRNSAVSAFLASNTPTEQMGKLKAELSGISLANGDYGIYFYSGNSKEFEELVDQSGDLNDLLFDEMMEAVFPANQNPKKLLVHTNNLVFVVGRNMIPLPI
jgi:ribosomal protein S18 acetylase RimI-like enzyme